MLEISNIDQLISLDVEEVMYGLIIDELINGKRTRNSTINVYPDGEPLELRDLVHNNLKKEQQERQHLQFEYQSLLILKSKETLYKISIISNHYERVIRGLDLETIFYKNFRPDIPIITRPLHDAIGNRPKEMHIFTHHLKQMGYNQYIDVIDRDLDLILHRMHDRIASSYPITENPPFDGR